MPGESTAQQPHRTPRANHKHSRSAAAAPVSDSEGFAAQAPSDHRKGNRRNQQARNAPQPVPAWQDNEASAMEGSFDAQGHFVSAFQNQNGQVPGIFYMSDGQPQGQGTNYAKKKTRPSKSGRYLNGANTPPHASSDNEQVLSAAMLQAMTPAKAAAYAGPTFHASPAANALPIPKFFSKSVPNDGAKAGLEARLSKEPVKSDGSDKTDSPPAVEAVPVVPVPEPDRSNESPLDFLFKADKEQKAKRQSAGITLTPPAKQNGNASSEPARANPWQSIYGTGSRNHHRLPSNGSGKEMFMMELDGREASPRPKKISPPPPLPRIPTRAISDHATIPQLSPQANFRNQPQSSPYHPGAHNASLPSLSASISDPRPMMDQSYSPFNRAAPYPTPRSADTTPTPQQQNLHPPQNGLHYGNRNLSPLFKAAKQDSMRPPSNLRQEVHPVPPQTGVVELPDNSPSRPQNPHRRASTHAEKAALAYLQTHVSSAPAMPQIPLPRAAPPAPSELDGSSAGPAPTAVTPPGVSALSTKNIEDDLRRMLKLTGGIK